MISIYSQAYIVSILNDLADDIESGFEISGFCIDYSNCTTADAATMRQIAAKVSAEPVSDKDVTFGDYLTLCHTVAFFTAFGTFYGSRDGDNSALASVFHKVTGRLNVRINDVRQSAPYSALAVADKIKADLKPKGAAPFLKAVEIEGVIPTPEAGKAFKGWTRDDASDHRDYLRGTVKTATTRH